MNKRLSLKIKKNILQNELNQITDEIKLQKETYTKQSLLLQEQEQKYQREEDNYKQTLAYLKEELKQVELKTQEEEKKEGKSK